MVPGPLFLALTKIGCFNYVLPSKRRVKGIDIVGRRSGRKQCPHMHIVLSTGKARMFLFKKTAFDMVVSICRVVSL